MAIGQAVDGARRWRHSAGRRVDRDIIGSGELGRARAILTTTIETAKDDAGRESVRFLGESEGDEKWMDGKRPENA